LKNTLLFSLILITFISIISCSSSNDKPVPPKASLTNTRWVLRVLNDKKIFTPEGGKEIFLTLNKDGNKANGTGGCNNFFSTFTENGSSLKFGPVASTEMFCQDKMDTESAFFKALGNTRTFKISGDNLFLSDSVKTVVAKLEAVYLN
jgi:heat shock protein HslJ